MDFQEKFFIDLGERLGKIEGKLDDIQGKVIYMYGFAAAIGLLGSFLIDWVKGALTAPPIN
jgi:hypothetical protein